MSQSFLGSQIAEPSEAEQTNVNTPEQSGTLALSSSDFAALEERVVRAVKLVKTERQARSEAEQRASDLEAQMRDQSALAASLQEELKALRTERDQVRQRVERLLSQLDALEL